MFYAKIDTMFNRDIKGAKQLIKGSFRDPVVKYLKDNIMI